MEGISAGGVVPGPGVRLQNGGQVSAGVRVRMVVHDGFHQLPDAGEAEIAADKGVHRHFIGGIVHGGHRAAAFSGPARQVQGGEGVRPRGLENQLADLREIELFQGIGNAVGPGDGVLDGEAHVRTAHLGQNGAVHVFHHGMHDALRVHDHVHLVHGDIEQPAGFDHLQSLVEQGGGNRW